MKQKIIIILDILSFACLSLFGMYSSYLRGYKIGYYSGETKGYYEGNKKGYKKGNNELNSEIPTSYYNRGFLYGYKVGKYNIKLTSYQDYITKQWGFVYTGENNDNIIDFKKCEYPECNTKTKKKLCGIHNCDYKGCNFPIMYSSTLYCCEHKCIIPECNSCKTKNTNYCKIHKK